MMQDAHPNVNDPRSLEEDLLVGDGEVNLGTLSPTLLRQLFVAMRRRYQALEVKHEALGQQYETVVAQQAHLEEQLSQGQKMEAIGMLAGGIAHDFNNTLAIILRFTEVARGQVPSENPVQDSLQEVLTAAKRARDMSQQILAFCRQHAPERRYLRWHELVHDTLTLLRSSIPATVSIQTQINTVSDTVLADATQLQQVVMNLCGNAEYAMRQTGGALELDLDVADVTLRGEADAADLRPGPYVRLTVRDTGPGISPEHLQRIFDPFFTTKAEREGTGMGLAVVQGIVASHDGAIQVKSTMGVGTTFEIYLPQQADLSPAAEEVVDAVPQTGQGSILFVDDEVGLACATEILLTDLGYDVSAYTEAQAALDAFRADADRFDLVIADQTMPQLTGKELAAALRDIRSDIPIIICTGYSHIIDAAQAEDQGINAFLMKPMDIYDLADTIHQVLSARTSGVKDGRSIS